MTDRGSGGFSLHPAWQALATRLAVAAGAIVALVSMLEHTPAWVASLRGALTFFVVRTVARWGLTALEQALSADHASRDGDTEEP